MATDPNVAATITVTPASGSIVHGKTVCKFAIASTEPNDVSEYSAALYPTEPEQVYYMTFVVSAVEVGRTQHFGTTPAGAFEFDNYIFPSAGTYTVQLYSVKDGAAGTPATIVVS